MRSGLQSLVLCGSLFTLACQPEFTVPDGVIISCSSADKCPSGLTCSESLGRCIKPGDDGLPLTVAGSPVWNTTNAAAGSVLQVTFSASKTLGTDPVVQLQVPGDASGQALRPMALTSNNDLSYVFSYRVTGDEGDGTGTVTVRLVDTFGNVADAQPLGTITFSFTAAAIAADSVHITPSHAQSGVIVDIVFKPSTSGTTVKKVLVGNKQATLTDPQPTDGSVQYQFGVSGGTEGALPITADLANVAGTLFPAVPVGTVITDFTAPTVTSVEIAKSRVHPGETEAVTVTFSEPLASTPRLELRRGSSNPTRFIATILSATQYRFEGVIRPADVGPQSFTVSLAQDIAGNTAAASEIGTVTVSSSKPALEAGSLTQIDPKAWVTTGDVLKVSFATTGAVQAPEVKIALASGQSIAMTQESVESTGTTGGSTYVFAHTIASTDPQGGGRIAVQLTDLFGNTAGPFTTGQFRIDYTAPQAASGVVATPASPIRIGALLVVTVNANEVLKSATLTATPSLTFTEPIVSGTAAIWTHTVTTDDAAGTYSLAASIVDQAGNTTTLTPAAVVLDTTLPSASSFSVTPNYATVGTTVRVVFDVSEALPEDPAVLLGEVALTKDETTSAGTHYVYTHVVGSSEPQRALPVTAALIDFAGNRNDTVLGQVNLDFTLFTPADVVVTPANPVPGDTITVVAHAHKPVGTGNYLQVRAPVGLTFDGPIVSGSTATWTHLVTAGDATGPIDLTVAVSDQAQHPFPIELNAVTTIGAGN